MNEKEDLFFQMAASVYLEDESERIEAELIAFHQDEISPPSPFILENALKALRTQQQSEQRSAFRRRTARQMMKAAGFILAIGVSGVLLITNVDAFRVSVTNFFLEQHDKYTSIRLEKEPSADLSDSVEIAWEEACAPTVLPPNYVLVKTKELGEAMHILTYSNGIDQEMIRLEQCAPTVHVTVDNEDIVAHDIKIHGYDGYWFNKKETTVVVWHNTKYVFILSLPENIENFIEIAESVKKVK